MLQTLRTAWKANRHWVAAGFLGATALFLLLLFMNWRNEQRGIASSRATGLAAVNSWSMQSMWRSSPLLPSWPRRERVRPVGVDYLTPSPRILAGSSRRGVIGGVGGTPPPSAVAYNSPSNASSEITERQVIRTGSIEIIVSDPLHTAEQLRTLAVNFSGFVVSSNVNGSDEGTTFAQVSMRIPADHFDEARAEVRKIAKTGGAGHHRSARCYA